MQVKVQKWGHSLALRIPKAIALNVNIRQDSTVDLSEVKGKLVITPVEKPEFTLEGLLPGVTKENIHREVSTGAFAGNEVW
ncbi:MAG: AbrB/MazE/SpoVT family DNA-binding domain-containing protein [Nitrospirota bacterium]